ncbi:hypothetical protein VNO77_09004 [Canavalia gladiata]|uniref:Uncharacterized protein n=1 Tax=Canavalia gladiata TaxID=3824 RepID=A0AAN9QX74_CANGL
MSQSRWHQAGMLLIQMHGSIRECLEDRNHESEMMLIRLRQDERASSISSFTILFQESCKGVRNLTWSENSTSFFQASQGYVFRRNWCVPSFHQDAPDPFVLAAISLLPSSFQMRDSKKKFPRRSLVPLFFFLFQSFSQRWESGEFLLGAGVVQLDGQFCGTQWVVICIGLVSCCYFESARPNSGTGMAQFGPLVILNIQRPSSATGRRHNGKENLGRNENSGRNSLDIMLIMTQYGVGEKLKGSVMCRARMGNLEGIGRASTTRLSISLWS